MLCLNDITLTFLFSWSIAKIISTIHAERGKFHNLFRYKSRTRIIWGCHRWNKRDRKSRKGGT